MMTLDKEKDYVDIMEVIDLMEGHRFGNPCANNDMGIYLT